jgi:diketogulonate reductase-like aldo/keto reductase
MHKSGHAFAGNGPIPAIGCGTWELRGETCAKIVAEALRVGYRHIDTAQGYSNEEAVGEGLRASGIPRSDVFLTTRFARSLSQTVPQQSVEESLRSSGSTPSIFSSSLANPAVPLREMMSALSDARAAA